MVLEMVMSRNATLKGWWKLLAIGAIYASIGLLLAAWVFPNYGSMVMIFLTVLAASYLMHEVILKEEEYDEASEHTQFDIFAHHGKAITIFMLLFFGMMIAYTFWYAVLPWVSTSDHGILQHLDVVTMFEAQNDTVERITGRAMSGAITGHVPGIDRFNVIFLNNLWVLFFSLLFGLFYGYGAIFVLAWNASVIAAAAGSTFKRAIATSTNGFEHIWIFFASWLQYMPHGVFEILAYFVAALASGILGAAIARRAWTDKDKLNRVFLDFVEYTVLSIIILFISAIIEVWITPALVL